ncbi:hypothetical protein FOQG_04206 [Fusarium oxysporum f. sp. raphani 54005]|uniref:Uncharacterized protein n=2 Tax=Fusarium oxysporum f. sp. raphani TaxID=96318 RepID=X0CNE1_FUSOX|nr:hypothetical protein FOQG_04206 [Fusarium oxysporum f. sp. raphani 54005]KAG7432483.1 hypothetical protein Forpi1262_v006902 [Fusarium oxysporum f. sp. raphani]
MNSHTKEARNWRSRSSDEMDELQNGAPEFEDIPSADMCRLPYGKIPETNAPPSSIDTARPRANRQTLARRVELLKAQKHHPRKGKAGG